MILIGNYFLCYTSTSLTISVLQFSRSSQFSVWEVSKIFETIELFLLLAHPKILESSNFGKTSKLFLIDDLFFFALTSKHSVKNAIFSRFLVFFNKRSLSLLCISPDSTENWNDFVKFCHHLVWFYVWDFVHVYYSTFWPVLMPDFKCATNKLILFSF